MGIGVFRIRALYDTGASRTVMGSIALQLATECGRTFQPASGGRARGAGNNLLRGTGHVDLPFDLGRVKRDILVSIIPALEVDCYVGSNFVRAFETMHDLVENRLIVGKSGKSIGLELACISTTDPKDLTHIRIASINTMKASSAGLADITLEEHQRLQALLNRPIPPADAALGRTDWAEHEIDFGNARPLRQKQFPISRKLKEEMHRQVRRFTSAAPARGARAPNRAICNSCL